MEKEKLISELEILTEKETRMSRAFEEMEKNYKNADIELKRKN